MKHKAFKFLQTITQTWREDNTTLMLIGPNLGQQVHAYDAC